MVNAKIKLKKDYFFNPLFDFTVIKVFLFVKIKFKNDYFVNSLFDFTVIKVFLFTNRMR